MAESIDIKSLNEKVKQQSLAIVGLLSEVSKVIVGQCFISSLKFLRPLRICS